MASDRERKRFFEVAIKDAESDYKKNNKDSQALTRWGGALLELANFHPGEEAAAMVDDAVFKFQKALDIEPNKHDTLWCLGNAYTSQGFLATKKSAALNLFTKANECFRDALAQQPDNDMYRKGLEMTYRAPDLYDEIQKQIAQQVTPARPQTSSTFWFDVLGWVTFVGLVVGVSAIISMGSPSQQQPAQTSSESSTTAK